MGAIRQPNDVRFCASYHLVGAWRGKKAALQASWGMLLCAQEKWCNPRICQRKEAVPAQQLRPTSFPLIRRLVCFYLSDSFWNDTFSFIVCYYNNFQGLQNRWVYILCSILGYRLYNVPLSFSMLARVSPVWCEYVFVQLTMALCLINLYSHSSHFTLPHPLW